MPLQFGDFCLWALLMSIFNKFFPLHLWLCSLEHLVKHILNWWELISNDVPQKATSYILVQLQLIDKALHNQMTELQRAKWKISMLDL